MSITTEDRQDGFFEAGATFTGSIAGQASLLPPFSGVSTGFEGVMEPLEIDFLKLDIGNSTSLTLPNVPTFNLTIDFEGFGGVKDLSFRDIVRILSMALEFLIGEGEAKECSGGLLAAKIGGKKIFTEQIPGKRDSSNRLDIVKRKASSTSLSLIEIFSHRCSSRSQRLRVSVFSPGSGDCSRNLA